MKNLLYKKHLLKEGNSTLSGTVQVLVRDLNKNNKVAQQCMQEYAATQADPVPNEVSAAEKCVQMIINQLNGKKK